MLNSYPCVFDSDARAKFDVPQPSTSRLAQRPIVRQCQRDVLLRNLYFHLVSWTTHLRIKGFGRLETYQPRMEP